MEKGIYRELGSAFESPKHDNEALEKQKDCLKPSLKVMTYNLQYISSTLRRKIKKASDKSHYFEKTLSFKSYPDAYVAPYVGWDKSIGCVLDNKGKPIQDSKCEEWKENGDLYDIQSAVFEHKTVIYLGFILNIFGHAFNDNLRKIWFTKTEEFRNLVSQGVEMVYTTSMNCPLPEAIVTVFALAGVDIAKARMVDKLTRFNQVIIPESCVIASEFGRMYNQDYIRVIDIIKEKCMPSKDDIVYDKIYFTRTGLKGKRDIGERRIERHFRRLGYSIVSPEKESIMTQIKMMRQCSYFAATEGSVAHLSLFCCPGTIVTIVSKANYLNFHQVMINEYADLNVTYIEAHHSVRANHQSPWWGPFFLYTSGYCKQFFNIHTITLPYWILPDYWFYIFYYSPFMGKIKGWVCSWLKVK